MSLLHSQRLLRTSLWRFASILPTFNLSLAESAESSQSVPNTIIEWHVTSIVCLVTWPLNESEAGGDLVMIETSLLSLCKYLLRHEYSIINIRKEGRFLWKQGYVQPHFHSKARHLNTQLWNGLFLAFKNLSEPQAFAHANAIFKVTEIQNLCRRANKSKSFLCESNNW